ncbi:MAG: alcohol dehydrogenase catalytic domain-containing protein [Streptosporangiales bacterium]|nr:alcohol dehydrogenase catalytic domain-containing protein [Streptosporangiales bacterium]
MRAATVVPGRPDSAAVTEIPEPSPADGAVLVEGMLIGICGTDVEIVRQRFGQPPPGEERLVLGHESVGRVLEAPAGSDLAPGDLVVGVVRRPDPEPCSCCARDQWDFCRNGRFTERGIKGRHGYGAGRWRIEEKFAVKIDSTLGDLGVLLEPTSVVAKAWEQIERIGARACFDARRVLITGAGPIGLLAGLLGVQRGFDVHVLDLVTTGPKPKLVAELGATYHHGGVGELGFEPDIVVECTGVGELVLDIAGSCAPGAIICLAGISSGQRRLPVNLDRINAELVMENTVLFGTVNAARRHYEQAASALLRADQGWLSGVISRRVPLRSWPDALSKRPDDVKVVVDLRD